MKLYLIDINEDMCKAWTDCIITHTEQLRNIGPQIEIYNGSFYSFMTHYYPYTDGYVSPANSYGLMDGGYDAALTEYFGPDMQRWVQSKIKDEYAGEQPICSCMPVWLPSGEGYLLHTPTMRVPSKILDPDIIYHCMRSALLTAKKLNLQGIVVPAFGAGCGGVSYDVVAKKMIDAIITIADPPSDLTWSYARWLHPSRLN